MSLRYSPPKMALGPRAKANEQARRITWPQALRRAWYRCEGCGAKDVDLVGHHIAGRPGSGFCLGPWANCVELLAVLCSDCHREAHLGDGQRREQLLWLGATRLFWRHPEPRPVVAQFTAPERIRELVRSLEASGIEPEGKG